jgi:hypothetical protein
LVVSRGVAGAAGGLVVAVGVDGQFADEIARGPDGVLIWSFEQAVHRPAGVVVRIDLLASAGSFRSSSKCMNNAMSCSFILCSRAGQMIGADGAPAGRQEPDSHARPTPMVHAAAVTS